MGFKDVFKKIGKIGLAAAPYVAAPFTGGASLYAAPYTSKALKSWNTHDAESNAAKGIGPSKFDRILGMGSDIAGNLSKSGALGKFGEAEYGQGDDEGGGGFGGILGNILKQRGGSRPMDENPYRDPGMSRPGTYNDGGLQSSLDDIIRVGGSNQGVGPSKGFDWKKLIGGGLAAAGGIYGAKKMYDAAQPKDVTKEYGPEEQYGQGTGRRLRRDWSTYGQGEDQRAPNLADAISQGRREAVRNQPWRDAEYDRTKRSSIYPSSSRRRKRTYEEQAAS